MGELDVPFIAISSIESRRTAENEKVMNLVFSIVHSPGYRDFAELLDIIISVDRNDLSWILELIETLSFDDPMLVEFMLYRDTSQWMTRMCKSTFVDDPIITVLVLNFSEHYFKNFRGIHDRLLKTEFFSLPLDILQMVTSDMFYCSDGYDRDDIETEIVCACLNLIGAFYGFKSVLKHDVNDEMLKILCANWVSTNQKIRKAAVAGLAQAVLRNCAGLARCVSPADICCGMGCLLESDDLDVRVWTLLIAEKVVACDKRSAKMIISKGVLNISLEKHNDVFVMRFFRVLRAAVSCGGDAVTHILTCPCVTDGVSMLSGRSFRVLVAACDFYSTLLRFPESVSFIHEHTDIITLLLNIACDGDVMMAERFIYGIASFFGYCEAPTLMNTYAGGIVERLKDRSDRSPRLDDLISHLA